MKLKRGTQIAYVPTHADENLEHPAVEFGFVTSVRDNVAFCRYWSKHHASELRTKANSEATPIDLIVEYKSVPQSMVHQELKAIDEWEQSQWL